FRDGDPSWAPACGFSGSPGADGSLPVGGVGSPGGAGSLPPGGAGSLPPGGAGSCPGGVGSWARATRPAISDAQRTSVLVRKPDLLMLPSPTVQSVRGSNSAAISRPYQLFTGISATISRAFSADQQIFRDRDHS